MSKFTCRTCGATLPETARAFANSHACAGCWREFDEMRDRVIERGTGNAERGISLGVSCVLRQSRRATGGKSARSPGVDLQGGAVVARRAHNAEVPGPIPGPATNSSGPREPDPDGAAARDKECLAPRAAADLGRGAFLTACGIELARIVAGERQCVL